ncbi:hypothetical protein [Dysgonomonas sp. GY617]|uniref:hypothetical protein n=1 Tax=Dysgonomonas sp. GY617 TaxID=2780420 RepID=UPI0018841EA6|nr:hypothetical protein [Dysgonomonas sp. GY617]MBF0575452.1 hypothetical protein [Dysgonomonas sp. GY617]
MRNNSILIIIFFLYSEIFVLGGCDPFSSYKQQLSEFPEEFVMHFPSKIEGKGYVTFSITDPTNKCVEFILYEVDLNIKQRLKQSLDQSSYKIYSANDSNLVTIKTNRDIRWNIVPKIYYKNIFANGQINYPIPYFAYMKFDNMVEGLTEENVFSNKTASGLSKDFTIYVLESKSGNFWKGLSPLDYMPDGWKNGFSRGVAIDEEKNIFISWFVAW